MGICVDYLSCLVSQVSERDKECSNALLSGRSALGERAAPPKTKLKQKNQWDTSGGRAGELAGNGSFFTAGGGDSHRHHFRYRNSIIIITTLKMINIIIIVKTSHLVGQAVGETQEPGLLPHTPALWAEN